MSETAPRRIRWDEILAYARRFDEYETVRRIERDARSVDVPLAQVTARRPRGRSLEHFGPLRVGAALAAGWKVEALALSPDCLRVQAGRDDTVVFALAAPGQDAP